MHYGNAEYVLVGELALMKVAGATILETDGLSPGCDVIRIRTTSGTLKLYHDQDCCESVLVEDVIGDPADLVGAVIRYIEERTDSGDNDYGTYTYTFYHVRTDRADVTIRWNGESNGYYSESVDYVLLREGYEHEA